jgi:hypothetical protein
MYSSLIVSGVMLGLRTLIMCVCVCVRVHPCNLFFNGTLVKAIKASKTMPHRLELKFKGDRLTYYVTDRRSIIQYLVDD